MNESTATYRLNLDHLAFYRAWMEGTFELEELAERYLETGSNRVAAKRTLRAVQDTLVAAARRAGKHGQARLLMLDKSALRAASAPSPTAAPGVPTFEEFIAQKDPDGFFSSEEIWEIYQAEYGEEIKAASQAKPLTDEQAVRREERNARLAKRRAQLIGELVLHLSRPPQVTDFVDAWFDETLSKPLIAAGFKTLGGVIELANAKGYLWYKSVPKLGPVRAQSLLRWFKRYDEAMGKPLTEFATTPRKKLPKAAIGVQSSYLQLAAATGYRPPLFPASQDGLYVPPEELDGSQGMNRAPASENRSGASNDFQAIQQWLATYSEPRHRHTQRSYRTTAERLLLWAVFVKQKAFSSLTTTDVIEFKAFLAEPKPYEKWVSHRMYPRFHPEWRPFIWRRRPKAQRHVMANSLIQAEDRHLNAQGEEIIAGLSEDSIKQSITILSGLCNWLVGQRYLDYNPFNGLAKKKRHKDINTGRSLTRRQWAFVKRVADELPDDDPRTARIRFVLLFAYMTGLRLTELVNARTGHLMVKDFGNDQLPMFLRVEGKGQETREVVIPQALQLALGQYLKARGLPEDPRVCPPSTPLIAKIYKTRSGAMTESALYRLLTDFFELAASKIPDPETPRGREDRFRLLQASTHWLRHTHGSHSVAMGASLAVVRQNLGHKSLSTTSIYVRAEEKLRAEQMEAFAAAALGDE